jgi:putative flippase GtrA
MRPWLRELSEYGAASAAVSFLSGAVVAYWLSISFAFRQHRQRDRRVGLLCFVAIGMGSLIINAAVIGFRVRFLGLRYLLAKCVAAGFSLSFCFLARRQPRFVVGLSKEISS